MEYNEIPRGHLSTMILSTLIDGEKYGYEIIKAIEEKTNGQISIKQPSLYSSLKRMEEQSLISSYWKDSDIGGKRHYYRLTDIGRKQTQKLQEELLESQNALKNIITKPQEKENKINFEDTQKQNDTPTILQQENIFDLAESKKEEVKTETYSPVEQYNIFDDSTTLKIDNKENNVDLAQNKYNIKYDISKFVKEKKSFADSIKELQEAETKTYTSNGYNYKQKENSLIISQDTIDNKSQDKSIQDLPNIEEVKSKEKDATIIITTPVPPREYIPKVKKIEPSHFEKMSLDSELSKRIGQNKFKTQEVNEEDASIVTDFNYNTDLSSLKNVYVGRNVYKNNTQTKNITHDKIYKIKTLSYIIAFILNCILSLSLYILFKDILNVDYNFLFILCPCLCIIPVIVCYLLRFNPIIKSKCSYSQFLKILILSIFISLIVLSINLLCGLSLENIGNYFAFTFEPILLFLSFPCAKLIQILTLKKI